MTCVVILAGGKSSRMGKDKAFLRGGVARIRQLALDAGVERVVTLGGDELRCELFEGEVIADPQGANGIGEILFSVINQIDDDIQLIPCDAYSLQSDGLQALLELEQGVPLGHRLFETFKPVESKCQLIEQSPHSLNQGLALSF